MNVRKIEQADFKNEVERFISHGKHGIIYGVVENPYVQVHRDTQVDKDICSKFGYGIVELFHNGGTLVLNPGDMVMGHFGSIGNGWYERFVSYFLEWLKARGLNAEYTSNDILVDGFKVSAYCVTVYGRIDYTGIFIGISTNLDHVKAICRKPMVKVPKGLSDYGITTEEVERMFLDFCEKDEN